MANPPTFANVQLLLPLDGADGATATTDASENALAISFHGNAQLDTAQSKFGGASLLLDGSGDYLRAALSGALMEFGTGDFTVEGWIRTTTVDRFIFDAGIYDELPTTWGLSIGPSGHLTWWNTDGFGTYVDVPGSAPTVTSGAWVHVAACRAGSTLRLFVNGAVVLSVTHSVNYANANSFLYIGEAAFSGGPAGLAFSGHMDDLRIVAEAVYTEAFTAPTAAHPLGGGAPVDAIASSPGPLSVPEALAYSLASISVAPGPLRAASLSGHSLALMASASGPLGDAGGNVVFVDFSLLLDENSPTAYVMELVTPGGLVRVPISSWQATLQTDVQSYVQCVVPAATDWVPHIEVASEFVIKRRGKLLGGSSIEYEMARAPAQTVSLDGGSSNYTATISGYTAALPALEDPPTALDRTLAGVRTVSRNSGNVRVRCNIDWLLRPGQRAYLDEEAIVVSFINYYVPGFDQYMDVGTRSA